MTDKATLTPEPLEPIEEVELKTEERSVQELLASLDLKTKEMKRRRRLSGNACRCRNCGGSGSSC